MNRDLGLVRRERRDLAGRDEHLDHRRRRPVRGQGGRTRPRRLPGNRRPQAGARARSTRWPDRPDPGRSPARTRRGGVASGCSMAASGLPPRRCSSARAFEHVAGPTKPIEGVVRSKATGQPVAGVHVSGQEARDLDLGLGRDRRPGPLPPRRPAQGPVLSGHRQSRVRCRRLLPRRRDHRQRHRGPQADRDDHRPARRGDRSPAG